MHVIQASGLCAKWKQPVYVAFDKGMTKVILDDISKRLWEIGFTVVMIVSDNGGGNQKLWKELQVSASRPFFEHCCIRSSLIFVFSDVPHLIKLIRNWLLDYGFLLPNGTLITKKPLEELLEKHGGTEISSIFKLTPRHLNCKRNERQNVRLATQLLSSTVAASLNRYVATEEAEELSKIIVRIDKWFDVMNSSTKKETTSECNFMSSFKLIHIVKEFHKMWTNFLRLIGFVYFFS